MQASRYERLTHNYTLTQGSTEDDVCTGEKDVDSFGYRRYRETAWQNSVDVRPHKGDVQSPSDGTHDIQEHGDGNGAADSGMPFA